MTSLAEAEMKYGYVVQSAGGKIFGIERTHSVGREEEKLRIGSPDGFVQMVVSLNQPNIDAVLHEKTSVVVKHAGELRGLRVRSLEALLCHEYPARDSPKHNAHHPQTVRTAICGGAIAFALLTSAEFAPVSAQIPRSRRHRTLIALTPPFSRYAAHGRLLRGQARSPPRGNTGAGTPSPRSCARLRGASHLPL